MHSNTVTLREIQRRYRALVDNVKKTKQPLYLGTRAKSEAVLLDVETYERLRKSAQRQIRDPKGGRQSVNLAQFIRQDRQIHETPARSH